MPAGSLLNDSGQQREARVAVRVFITRLRLQRQREDLPNRLVAADWQVEIARGQRKPGRVGEQVMNGDPPLIDRHASKML
jgi:hypothetical protein